MNKIKISAEQINKIFDPPPQKINKIKQNINY